jgi:hypothetical protein
MKTSTILLLAAGAAAIAYFALRPSAPRSSSSRAPQSPEDTAANAGIELGSRLIGGFIDNLFAEDVPIDLAPSAASEDFGLDLELADFAA